MPSDSSVPPTPPPHHHPRAPHAHRPDRGSGNGDAVATAQPAWRAIDDVDMDVGAGEHDALADLFLGEVGVAAAAAPGPTARGPQKATSAVSSARPAHPPRAATGTFLECLILGHLPVLAGAWAMQYARCAAEVEGAPVGFVQIRGRDVSVQMIGESPSSPPRPQESLEAAARVLSAAGVRRWILRVDAADEELIAANPALGAVTLVTSAHGMAVVGAYQVLQRLSEAGQDADAPPVRISIMGADEPSGDAAFRKLAEAARTFIGRPVERAIGASEIDSRGAGAVVFDGPVDGGSDEVLDTLSSVPAVAPQPRDVPAPDLQPAAPAIQPTPAAAPAPSHQPPAQPTTQPQILRGPAVERRADDVSASPLARHIPGLRAVESLTCPYAPGAEFALDARGRLAILVHDLVSGDGRPATETLSTAAAWATSHAPLLAAFISQQTGTNPSGEPPALHLFSPDPAPLRRLPDAGIHLHILAQVHAGPHRVWFSRPVG